MPRPGAMCARAHVFLLPGDLVFGPPRSCSHLFRADSGESAVFCQGVALPTLISSLLGGSQTTWSLDAEISMPPHPQQLGASSSPAVTPCVKSRVCDTIVILLSCYTEQLVVHFPSGFSSLSTPDPSGLIVFPC